MSAPPISDDVKQFIRENIHSVEQLEVLLLLRSEPEKEWNEIEVSQRLFTVPASAAMRLADLQSRGLLLVRGESQARLYRYAPPNSDTERIIASLDRAYRERKTSIIDLIFSRSSRHIQAFADAFRLRRKD